MINPADYDYVAADAIEDWTAHGLRCIVRPAYHCLGGYVRLPDAFVGKPQLLAAVRGAISHGYRGAPITYGPWEDPDTAYNPCWVGFHTGHFWNYWHPDDVRDLLDGKGFAMATSIYQISKDYEGNITHRCTREWLHDTVEQLALAISTLREGL